MRILLSLLLLATAASAQRVVMNANELEKLTTRMLDVMDATSVAIPEMVRFGQPFRENGKIALERLQSAPGRTHTAHTYAFMTQVRAFLLLVDAVPKPEPFPAAAKNQIAELREGYSRLERHFTATLEARESLLRTPDRDNLRRYAEANEKVSAPQAGKPRVVFLGDSITDGWRIQEYFPDRDFVNRGISGQVTSEMLGRFKADVVDLKPAAVLILAGTNDLARGTTLPVIQNNLTMMCELAEYHKIKVILASVLPTSDYHKDKNPSFEMTKLRPLDKIRALNNWIRTYCENHGHTFLNYAPAVSDAYGLLKAELADDGLHPNAAGYRAMAPVALEAIEKTLAPVAVTRKKK
jgi:lysophospholipase L1-like esterase